MSHTYVTYPQRKALRNLEALAERTIRAARTNADRQRDLAEGEQRLVTLKQQNPDLLEPDARLAASSMLVAVAICCAVLVDAVLAGQFGEYIATSYLKLPEQWATVIGYVMPILVIAIEMGLAQLRSADGVKSGLRFMATGLAIGMLIVMPLLVGLTVMEASESQSITLFVVVMSALTLCIHAIVLFTGPQQIELLAWLACRRQYRRLARGNTGLRTGVAGGTREVTDSFGAYATSREAFVRQYPHAAVPQPHWGPEVIAEVNRAFGEEVIRRGQAQNPQPEGVRDGAERRRRERDAEVAGD